VILRLLADFGKEVGVDCLSCVAPDIVSFSPGCLLATC